MYTCIYTYMYIYIHIYTYTTDTNENDVGVRSRALDGGPPAGLGPPAEAPASIYSIV